MQLENRFIIERTLAFKNNKETEFDRNWKLYTPFVKKFNN